jgi:hypothetical protein
LMMGCIVERVTYGLRDMVACFAKRTGRLDKCFETSVLVGNITVVDPFSIVLPVVFLFGYAAVALNDLAPVQ